MDFRGMGDGVTMNTEASEGFFFNLFLMLKWQYTWNENNILFWLLAMWACFIYHLTAKTVLTQYQKVRDQFETI